MTDLLPSAVSQQPVDFGREYHGALRDLRGALAQIVEHAAGRDCRPQELSRRFGLDKNLAWKVSRLIAATDPCAALRFVPGAAGRRIVRDRLGAELRPEFLASFDAAVARFEAMIRAHAGDRATLELLVQGIAPATHTEEGQEQARRQAFFGNSGTWGVQAATQLSIHLVLPSRTATGRADVLQVGGLLGFRRLRSHARWLLFTREAYGGEGVELRAPRGEPLVEPPPGLDGVPLMPSFCSKPAPRVVALDDGRQVRYELPPGPVGNAGRLDCVYGVRIPAGSPRHLAPQVTASGLGTQLLTPVESLEFYLLLHEDLNWQVAEQLLVLGRIDGSTRYGLQEREDRRLPLNAPFEFLGPDPTRVRSPRLRRLGALMELLVEHSGEQAHRFGVWRCALRYPPLPTSALAACELPPSGA